MKREAAKGGCIKVQHLVPENNIGFLVRLGQARNKSLSVHTQSWPQFTQVNVTYWHLYHAMENTANHITEKLLYTQRYYTQPSHRAALYYLANAFR